VKKGALCFFAIGSVLLLFSCGPSSRDEIPVSTEDPLALVIAASAQRPSKEISLKLATSVTDTDTEIRVILIHAYAGTAADPLLWNLMAAFKRNDGLEPVRWLVIVSSRDQASEVTASLKQRGARDLEKILRFVVAGEECGPWTRDWYAAYRGSKADEFGIQAVRQKDDQCARNVADQLASASLGWDIQIGKVAAEIRPNHEFAVQGGDIAFDDTYVYLGEQSLETVVTRGSFASRASAIDAIENLMGKKVIALDGPDAHLDRFLMPLGVVHGRPTVLLGDPIQVFEIFSKMSEKEKEAAADSILKGYLTDSEKMRRQVMIFFNSHEAMIRRLSETLHVAKLNSIEKDLTEKGFDVIRIPSLHRKIVHVGYFPIGFYYVNLVQDVYRTKNGKIRRKIIVPEYGIEALDRRVQEILGSLEGVDEVRPITLIREGYLHAGLRCLVHILGNPVKTEDK